MPVVLGGDHSITHPVVRALDGPLHVVQFDAHLDYAEPRGTYRYTNAHAFRQISRMDSVRGLLQVGIRSLRTEAGLYRESLADGNRIVPPDELRELGAAGLAALLPEGGHCYVSGASAGRGARRDRRRAPRRMTIVDLTHPLGASVYNPPGFPPVRVEQLPCAPGAVAVGARPDGFGFPVHRALLGAGIPIVENVAGLAAVAGRRFRGHVCPIPIAGADGAPARVFAQLEAPR